MYFTLSFTLSLYAQENTSDLSKLHGYDMSRNEGILSKIDPVAQKAHSLYEASPFYSNAHTDKKHGLSAFQSQHRNSDFEFLEHLGTGMNIPYSSVTDSFGNTYITGAASNEESARGNFMTLKVDTNGEIIWEARQEGTLYAVEYGVEITLDGSENPIATGVHWNGNDLDVFTIKYDQATGNEIWSTNFDGGHTAFDVPTTITVTTAGDILIGGITYTGASVEYVLLKYNSAGQLQWSATDTNPISQSWNEPTAIATDASGNIAITGFAAVDGDSQGYWEGYLTLVYDQNGTQLWRQPYLFERNIDENDPNSEIINTHSAAKSLAFDTDGNVVVTGTFDVANADRIGTIKYSASGNEEWVKTYRAGEFDNDITNGHKVKIAETNKIYIAGRHRNAWIDEGIVLLSYASDGSENWTAENQNLIQIQTAKMILDANNLPIVGGLGYDEGTEDRRVRIFRYSDTGEVLDETNYLKVDSDTEGIQDFIGLALDAQDNVFVVLDNYYTAKGGVFETVKMPFDSGANNPDWTSIFETPLSSSNTRMLNSVTDSQSNTYVTGDFGVIENNAYFRNFFVAKYNEAGEVVWEKDYNQQNGNETDGIVAKIDSEGNVVVFLLPSPQSTLPLHIKKYTATGNLLWETEKEIHNALLRAFFLDDDDNLYIGGNSKENPSDFSPVFTTIKYTAEGDEAWTRFADTGNPDDTVFEVNAGIVNGEGEIILTGVSGYTTMFSEVVDLTALKYSGSGNLEWLNKYPQPNFGSAGTDVLVDDANNIYIAGVQQETVNNIEELVALKLNTDGEALWTTSYGQSNEGRRIRPYKIVKNSEGNILIPSYSLYWVIGETPNNRITTLQLDAENGEIAWEHNSEIGRYYRDFYLDGDDNIFIWNQTGEFSYRRVSSYTVGALLKLDGNGQDIEENFFVGPELPDFDPATITPLNNGTLLLGGTLYNDSFFSGLYFFESTHIPLGIGENENPQNMDADWLGQNYPNPVQSTTTIPFFLKSGGETSIAIYDNLGREVYSLRNELFNAGNNELKVDVSQLETGIYFYQIKNGPFKAARKLIKQ